MSDFNRNLQGLENAKRTKLGKAAKAKSDIAVAKQSLFDRKAEEMKAFLKRNPVPKEFLN